MKRIVDHREYVERYLASQSGETFGVADYRALSDHVANCKECEVLLANEHAIRKMLQENVRVIPAPEALRRRILTALDSEDRKSAREAQWRWVRKPTLWFVGASLAASLTLITLNFWSRPVDNPAFDNAVSSFTASEKHFAPTVGARSIDELATALINQFGVAPVWDFSSIGLTSEGARIDKTANGKVIAYSMYKGSRGSLLCIITQSDGFHLPSGARVVKGIHLYSYKGYTIAATNRYSVFCVMISDLPVEDLASAFDHLPA